MGGGGGQSTSKWNFVSLSVQCWKHFTHFWFSKTISVLKICVQCYIPNATAIASKNMSKYCKLASDQLPSRNYYLHEISHVEDKTKFKITNKMQKYMLKWVYN